MTAKEYLSSIRKMEQELDLERRMLEHWSNQAESVKASNYEPNYNSTKPTSAPFELCLMKKAEKEESVKRVEAKLADRRAEVGRLLSKVESSTYRSVLELRYLSGLSWDKIARKLCFSDRWVLKLHGQALLEVEKLMGQNLEKDS